MEETPRPLDQLRTIAWLVLVPLVAVLTLPFLVLEIGPAYQARFGGTPGVFTAQREVCADQTCRWFGEFRSVDGVVRRADVSLIGGRDIGAPGDRVGAVDIGKAGSVYPAGGGGNWLIVTALLVVLVVALAFWAATVRRRLRRRGDERGTERE